MEAGQLSFFEDTLDLRYPHFWHSFQKRNDFDRLWIPEIYGMDREISSADEILVLRGDNIPKPTNKKVFFSRTEAMESDKILRLMEFPNYERSTGACRILYSKREVKGVLFTIGIDPRSEKILRTERCSLKFRFGRIPVS